MLARLQDNRVFLCLSNCVISNCRFLLAREKHTLWDWRVSHTFHCVISLFGRANDIANWNCRILWEFVCPDNTLLLIGSEFIFVFVWLVNINIVATNDHRYFKSNGQKRDSDCFQQPSSLKNSNSVKGLKPCGRP